MSDGASVHHNVAGSHSEKFPADGSANYIDRTGIRARNVVTDDDILRTYSSTEFSGQTSAHRHAGVGEDAVVRGAYIADNIAACCGECSASVHRDDSNTATFQIKC